jgi:mono/diheme cytochrome c family protein
MKFACLYALVYTLAIAQEPAQHAPNPTVRTREFLGLGPAPDSKAAQAGEPLYKENCGGCHGPTARGAQGPNLIRSPLVLHDEKGEEIGQVVKKGGGGMPAFPGLSDEQIHQIAEFIHMQVELAANRGTYGETYGKGRSEVTGDAAKGKDLFEVRCAKCHSASGDLAGIGKKYPQASAMLPHFVWPASAASKTITVITPQGETVTGEAAVFDDFDVALRDAHGEYRSWARSEVKVEIPDQLAGHRALLPTYSDADLHNLTAYLVTLK